MAKTSKPWFRKGRGWFVTIGGKQHNLGREKKTAYYEYYRLMQQPVERRKVSGQSLAAIIDDFLEYLSKNRAPDTYRWYRDLLQKFIVLHADLRVDDIRPYHVQRWVDGYEHLSKSSRTNHLRAVKRCVKWAVTQGYLDRNQRLFTFVLAAPVFAPNGKTSPVPGTNNEAEQGVRGPAMDRSTGRTTRTIRGSRRRTVIDSVLQSLRKYLPEFTLDSVVKETGSWKAQGRSCFKRLLDKLKRASKRQAETAPTSLSVLDALLPIPAD